MDQPIATRRIAIEMIRIKLMTIPRHRRLAGYYLIGLPTLPRQSNGGKLSLQPTTILCLGKDRVPGTSSRLRYEVVTNKTVAPRINTPVPRNILQTHTSL
ncbi:MAG: hypothetical protein JRJ42_11275 [Deltaproteobacteria bacterium]|nr:hypothetical protein [Deltaproteobacteria bacterium]